MVDVRAVAAHHIAEHGRRNVVLLTDVDERAQVLWQARSAESKARFHVHRRNVEARVPADKFHHRAAVHVRTARETADLIGECDLDRVERVAGVLEHLGHADRT